MRLLSMVLGFMAVLSAAAPAASRPFRVADIPNGSKNTCLNCHIDLKPSAQNDFGSDAQTALFGSDTVPFKHVDWSKICPLDSDGDGWTNGLELADPSCTWVEGDANPMGAIYNPGDPEIHPPPVCGNGKLDGGERCEGDLMKSTDCALVLAGEGTLKCADNCTYDYSGCSEPPDGVPFPEGGGPAAEEGCSAAPGASGSSYGALALILGLAAARGLTRRRPRRR